MTPSRQKGAALLLTFLLLFTLSSAYLVSKLTAKTSQSTGTATKTNQALIEAKQALIAWSVANGTDSGMARPGELPCPDRNAPGSANEGTAGTGGAAACTTAGSRIGRLPWKTLGIAKTLDGDGNALWYALSPNFRQASQGTEPPININTLGTLLVYDASGTLLTPSGEEAAAVIIAPGTPVGGQSRNNATAANQYLEGTTVNGIAGNNANSTGPFIAGPVGDGSKVNDRIVYITARELLNAVEQRVFLEAQRILRTATTQPPASPTACVANRTSIATGTGYCAATTGACIGRVPDGDPYDPRWSSVPQWFADNGWGRNMVWANGNAPGCNPSSVPTVNGSSTWMMVLISPGPSLSGPRTAPPSSATLPLFVEDAANRDAFANGPAGGPPASTFTIPVRSGTNNDRMTCFNKAQSCWNACVSTPACP